MRQGPHQLAQKSKRTSPLKDLTSDSKLVLVMVMGDILVFLSFIREICFAVIFCGKSGFIQLSLLAPRISR